MTKKGEYVLSSPSSISINSQNHLKVNPEEKCMVKSFAPRIEHIERKDHVSFTCQLMIIVVYHAFFALYQFLVAG